MRGKLSTTMGGLGSHHVHPYIVQTAAFLLSVLLPGGVFALLIGAWVERARRRLLPPNDESMTPLLACERALAE